MSGEQPPSGAGPRRLGGDPPSPWEEQFGFSRVVEAGGFIRIGGTTSVGPSGVVLGQSPYEQSIEIFTKLDHELRRVGSSFADVIEVRAYVTQISRADEVGRAFSEALAEVRPLMTMIEVNALIDPRMFVEIELVAYRG